MERSTIIITIVVVVGLGGMGYHFYSDYQAKVESERVAHEVAVKAATEKEKKAATELKRMQDKEQESNRKVAELERQQQQVATGPADDTMVVGPLKPGAVPGGPAKPSHKRQTALVGDAPPPGQPVPPIIPAAEKFIAEARLTSTSLDNASTPYAVINRQTYRVGNRIAIAPGQELTVATIEDGFITFTGGTYKFQMRLTSMSQ
jgi:hypothetical protein